MQITVSCNTNTSEFKHAPCPCVLLYNGSLIKWKMEVADFTLKIQNNSFFVIFLWYIFNFDKKRSRDMVQKGWKCIYDFSSTFCYLPFCDAPKNGRLDQSSKQTGNSLIANLVVLQTHAQTHTHTHTHTHTQRKTENKNLKTHQRFWWKRSTERSCCASPHSSKTSSFLAVDTSPF